MACRQVLGSFGWRVQGTSFLVLHSPYPMTPLSTPCLNAGFVELIFIPSLIFNLVLHPHCLLISIVDQDTKQGFFVQGTCLPRGSVMVMFPGCRFATRNMSHQKVCARPGGLAQASLTLVPTNGPCMACKNENKTHALQLRSDTSLSSVDRATAERSSRLFCAPGRKPRSVGVARPRYRAAVTAMSQGPSTG
jgi:hypothetical protein